MELTPEHVASRSAITSSERSAMSTKTRRLIAGAIATATVAVPLLTSGTPAQAADGGHRSTYIVRAVPGQLPAVADELTALGGTVTRRIGLIDAAVVSLPARAVPVLRHDPRVSAVTEDAH